MDTPTTTPIDLGAIEARLNAATPGPWIGMSSSDGDGSFEGEIRSADFAHIATLTDTNPDADERLIAHAPEDLRALLAEVRRLRADVFRARMVGLQEAAAFLNMAAEKMEAGGIEDAPAGDVVAALIEGLMARATDESR